MKIRDLVLSLIAAAIRHRLAVSLPWWGEVCAGCKNGKLLKYGYDNEYAACDMCEGSSERIATERFLLAGLANLLESEVWLTGVSCRSEA